MLINKQRFINFDVATDAAVVKMLVKGGKTEEQAASAVAAHAEDLHAHALREFRRIAGTRGVDEIENVRNEWLEELGPWVETNLS